MRDQNCSFKEAVKIYLEKHQASKKVVQDFLKTFESDSELFVKAIDKLREKQEQKDK